MITRLANAGLYCIGFSEQHFVLQIRPGDLGFLLGGIAAGALASATSITTALQGCGVVYSACTLWFLARAMTGQRA
eukprot:scaffold656072_cov51-Prasinocladus_malaysianus.AAC.1